MVLSHRIELWTSSLPRARFLSLLSALPGRRQGPHNGRAVVRVFISYSERQAEHLLPSEAAYMRTKACNDDSKGRADRLAAYRALS